MHRFHQIILFVSLGLGSWLGMQLVHETGHVVGAWMSGGRVERVVLNPLTITRTDVGENPHPLIVVWAGPLFGASVPLSFWLAAVVLRFTERYLLRFFAGFCLVANGLYIGIGSFTGIGDCGEMLRYGSPAWQLWLFGALAAPCGFWLWNGQGKWFGLGKSPEQVNPKAAYLCLVVCLLLTALAFFIGGE